MSFDDGVVTLTPRQAIDIAEILLEAGNEHDHVRVAIDDGGVKLAVGRGVWSLPIGRYQGDD